MKLGEAAKNKLKIKDNAEILAQEYFQKQGNQLLKRNSHTHAPAVLCIICMTPINALVCVHTDLH